MVIGSKRSGASRMATIRGALRLVRCQMLAAAIVMCAACQSLGGTSTNRLDRTVITRDEMLKGNFVSLYDAVAALRSVWLRPRGPDSFTNPSIVWVYIDGARIG